MKQGYLQDFNYQVQNGSVSGLKGMYSSAHEQWKFLVLPYRDVNQSCNSFMNTEKAVTWYTSLNNWLGLLSEANDNNTFVANTGIPSFSMTTGSYVTNLISPGAAFPLALADLTTGVIWFHYMSKNSFMQTNLGVAESYKSNTTLWTPLVSWDTKIPMVLSIIDGVMADSCCSSQCNSACACNSRACGNTEGGISKQIGYYLTKDGLMSKFTSVISSYYNLTPSKSANSVNFAFPYDVVV